MVRLSRYFFPVQYVRANPEFDPNGVKNKANNSIHFSFSKVPNKENDYGVEATIKLDEDTSENPPYFFELLVVGFFSIVTTADSNNENPEEILKTTAPQILIGATRERLIELTSRGPWGPHLINIVPEKIVADVLFQKNDE